MKHKYGTLWIVLIAAMLVSACSSKPIKQEETSLTAETEVSESHVQDILASVAGIWRLDAVKTNEHLKANDSLQMMFDTGQCEIDGEGIRVPITPYEELGEYENPLHLTMKTEQETEYLVMEYSGEDLYWIMGE